MSQLETTTITVKKDKKKDKSSKRKDTPEVEVLEEQTAISPSPSKKRKRDSNVDPTQEIEVDVNAPEPPSKKDLRKLKKLKDKGVDVEALQAAKVPIIDNSQKGAQEGEKPQVESKHSKYGVWIGNLSFNTTREQLLEFFTTGTVAPKAITSTDSDAAKGANTEILQKKRVHKRDEKETDDVSEIEAETKQEPSKTGITTKDITRIHLPKSTKFPKQNKGFAYVDFQTAASIPHALKLSEKLLYGRKVLIKASTDFQGRPEVSKADEASSVGKNPPSRSIFVGNLGFETTEDTLRDHFQAAGKIKGVRMTTFEDSGKCKGFGWIDFEDLESAKNALVGKKIEPVKGDLDESSDEESRKKRRKKSDNNRRLKKFNYLGGRALRLEYGEDATTRYNKRHKKPAGEAGEDGGDGMQVDGEWKKPMRERRERKVDARTIAPGAALAKAMENRLTARIVESTGTKTTFD